MTGRTPAHGMVRSEPAARSRPRRRRSRIPGRTIPYGTQDGFCLPHSWVPGMPTARLLARRDMNIQRLIVRTALGCHLRSRRSVQRFERDTYHGDALPTELRGRVFNCLTWGFAPRGGQLKSCTAVTHVDLTQRPRPRHPPRALESLPHPCGRDVSPWRRRASPRARSPAPTMGPPPPRQSSTFWREDGFWVGTDTSRPMAIRDAADACELRSVLAGRTVPADTTTQQSAVTQRRMAS